MSDAAIDVRGVEKRFGSVRALAGLDLRVERGSVYGVIGPNGAGKTTLLGVLAGFLGVDAGEVAVLGALLPRDRKRLLGRIGVLPQGAALPPHETVGRYLRDCARLLAMRAHDARAAAHDALEKTGMETAEATRIGTLSHGLARRVALAQAFLGEPELVLLDEPTDSLDPKSAALVRRRIGALRGKATILISSHNLAELETLCDCAAILREGRVVQEGTMSVLTAAHAEVSFVIAAGWDEAGESGGRADAARRAMTQQKHVIAVDWRPGERSFVVGFDPQQAPAETMIPALLRLLLDAGAPVVEVRRGRGLEAAVLDVT